MKILKTITWLILTVAVCLFSYKFYSAYNEALNNKADIAHRDNTISNLGNSVKNIIYGNETKKKSEEIADIIIANVNVINKKEENKQNANFDKAEKTIVAIKKEYIKKIQVTKEPEKVSLLIREQEVEVSKNRMASLWDNYCQHETTDFECENRT